MPQMIHIYPKVFFPPKIFGLFLLPTSQIALFVLEFDPLGSLTFKMTKNIYNYFI